MSSHPFCPEHSNGDPQGSGGQAAGSSQEAEAAVSAGQNREALYWRRLDRGRIECLLCPHHCRISSGQLGFCQARKQVDGMLVADSYAKVTALSLDPIEKKPLHRFFPGSSILSVGSYGCNFRCSFCQNWQISQTKADWQQIEPDQLVTLAVRERTRGNIGLAYTYNEPLVGYEYVLDCARLVRAAGMKNIVVTNGSINPEPLAALLPWIDAMNIDLKAWQPDFYRKQCKGELQPVLDAIEHAAAACHVEITTLLIPGLNDDPEEITALARWLAGIDPEITLHLTRHHPDYHLMDSEPISGQRMLLLLECARRWLKYVVPGNMPG